MTGIEMRNDLDKILDVMKNYQQNVLSYKMECNIKGDACRQTYISIRNNLEMVKDKLAAIANELITADDVDFDQDGDNSRDGVIANIKVTEQMVIEQIRGLDEIHSLLVLMFDKSGNA